MRLQVRVVLAALLAAAATFVAGGGLAQDEPTSDLSSPDLSSPAPIAPAPAAPRAAPRTSSPIALAAPTPPTPTGRLPPDQPIPPAELEAFVDGVASEAMASQHIAGAAVAVVQNGQVTFKKGYGIDRLSPARAVDPDRTLFRLGPVTETFAWIALMREIESGHIRLDASVNVYLPQADQVPDQGYKRQVLVRDLMTHSAGFEDRSFGQLIEKDPARIRPLDVYLKEERPRRVREGGSLPSYSNYDAALAGEALTQVTGKTMQALVESEITGPLGLRRTTLREPYPRRGNLPAPMDPGLASDISEGMGWTGSGYRARPFEFMTQAAAAVAGSSTAADMSRFMLAVLNDGTLDGAVIYSPALAKDFRTPLQRAAPGVGGLDHGVFEFALPGGYQGYGQAGQTLSFHVRLVTIPALKLGVFVAANTGTSAPFVDGLAGRIVERFYAPPAPPAPAPSSWLKDNASAFVGTYLTTDRDYHGLEGFVDLLRGGQKLTVADDGVLLTPGPGGPRHWTPDANASLDAPYVNFRQADGPDTLVFEMKNGRAQRWFAPAGAAAYERSGPLSGPWLLAVLAAGTGVASISAIAGLFLRDRRDFRQTTVQGRADAAQLSASILWLAALACFGLWALGASDAANLAFGWPGAWLVIASSSALVAMLLTVLCLGLQPVVWRGGRRLDSWTTGRKARFAATTLIFALFALMLGLWGALEPWSS